MGAGIKDFVVIMSVSVASVIALAVIVSTVILPFFNISAPKELKNWGGLIIGFYFGSFVGLLKDWSGVGSSEG